MTGPGFDLVRLLYYPNNNDTRFFEKFEDIMQKMEACGKKLDVWNRNEFCNVQHQLSRVKHRVQNILEEDPSFSDKDRYHTARKEVNT